MKEFFAFPFRIRVLYNNFPQKSHHRKAKFFILFIFRVLLILHLRSGFYGDKTVPAFQKHVLNIQDQKHFSPIIKKHLSLYMSYSVCIPFFPDMMLIGLQIRWKKLLVAAILLLAPTYFSSQCHKKESNNYTLISIHLVWA